MNPHTIKRLFPNVSASTLAANAADYALSALPSEKLAQMPRASTETPVVKPEAPKQPMRFTIPGNPVGKPRQTRRDKWAKRPRVMRYRAWADSARAAASTVIDPGFEADTILIKAWLAMPKSWSKKKCVAMQGQFHRQKPDLDNILKAAQDALFGDDSSIAFACAEKRWDDGNGPRIEVSVQ